MISYIKCYIFFKKKKRISCELHYILSSLLSVTDKLIISIYHNINMLESNLTINKNRDSRIN